jgi:hypothetical protein
VAAGSKHSTKKSPSRAGRASYKSSGNSMLNIEYQVKSLHNSQINKVMNHGVVTLLDVLGWKGIWQRYKGNEEEPIQRLMSLVTMAERFTEAWMRTYVEGEDGQKFGYKVICVSDTILIATWTTEENDFFQKHILESHANMSAALVRYSIIAGIPFRGACSVGKFIIGGNSFIGPAIDEVASYYEKANWLGVIFTRSAKETYTNKFGKAFLYDAPLKDGEFNTYCVDWPAAWRNNAWIKLIWNNQIPADIDTEPKTREDLEKYFSVLAPSNPDITMSLEIIIKYKNACKFFDSGRTES